MGNSMLRLVAHGLTRYHDLMGLARVSLLTVVIRLYARARITRVL